MDGLVFYKAASINYGKSDGNGGLTPLTALTDVSGLAYTIKDSTGYAPSYQIGIMGGSMKVTYARLVWEPYQQDVSPGDDKGTYTQIENGRWWAANVWIVNPDPTDTDHSTVKRTPSMAMLTVRSPSRNRCPSSRITSGPIPRWRSSN